MDEDRSLRLCVLGELEATRDSTVVDLGGRRQRAVLAALVIARGQVVTADHLTDCVWGDDAPANPTGALHSYISHLRRRLQPQVEARRRDGVIARSGPGYVASLTPDAVDAWRFERAVQSAAGQAPTEAARMLHDALRLWRGPAYAEYAGEPWTEAEITRLDELRAAAREQLMDARLRRGESAVLVGELEALVAENPLREERWRLLVLALYRAHRQADALSALRRAREMLAEELGVDPGPALRLLEREVLTQSPALDGPSGHVPAPRAAGPAPTLDPVPSTDTPPAPSPAPDLADRDRETAVLRRTVNALRAGTPGLVVVEGPAGIGKSRLLTEAVRLATSAEVAVLSARGSQLEHSFGLGVVRQLLEPCVKDPARREALFRGAAAGARTVFEHATVDELAHDGSFAVLHGLYWLTVNLAADGPLMVSVDDVHWCDNASLRYLAYLVKRLEGLPAVVVLTRRTGEHDPDDPLLTELALEPASTVLRPQPLSPEATGDLVRELLGEGADAFVDACHRMTSGNPLLLRQLLRALEDQGIRPDVSHTDTVRAVGSRAVSGLVMLRLRRMPDGVTAAARAVAVLGQAADLPTVAALARLPEEQAATALDVLSRGEILNEEQRPAFVHPLVRDAVYEDLPVAERALYHERAAHLLRQREADAEQVTAHLLRAPRRGDGVTVEVLRTAARRALERGASDVAVMQLRRALEEPAQGPEHVDVLVELGLAETLVDGPAAVAHLSEAYPFLDESQRAPVAMILARTHIFASDPGTATEFAREAAASLPTELDDARQGLLALQRISGHMHRLPPATYRPGPRPEVRGDGDGARMLAATLAYELLLDGEDRAGAVELARFALEGDRLFAVDNGLLWVIAASVLMLADGDLGNFWDRASAHAHATGGLFAVLSVNLWRGFDQWRRGQLEDALQSLSDAVEQQHMWRIGGASATYAAAFTVGVQLDRGDLDAAARELDAARALPQVGEGSRLLREAAARLLVQQGRASSALDELAAAGVGSAGVANPVWSPWRGLKACALAALGRVDEAVALAEDEVALLRRWGARSSLGRSLRLLGELRGADGTAHLREAVHVLAPADAALELARARLALGRAPDVADEEAVDLLREALNAARACGARAVVDDALTALTQRGQRLHDAGEISYRLTNRQQQVLDLAATGLSVNEVAQRLFLTPGTVHTLIESAADRPS